MNSYPLGIRPLWSVDPNPVRDPIYGLKIGDNKCLMDLSFGLFTRENFEEMRFVKWEEVKENGKEIPTKSDQSDA